MIKYIYYAKIFELFLMDIKILRREGMREGGRWEQIVRSNKITKKKICRFY